ncbi:PREDICTED: probable C-mannosyltransferase DPY19L2 [Galeopterus variegatus]|uniref:Probable C-mannosyltransferase DPY19L2 n=1 Tax=Galeopterus variegatus TaxID=482537 RepID=A0ABM0SH31_GALVR|nr:PREDICTED: probable C-mannosyltransferase DPY19L2 [Galeopterus variegatus]
MLRGESGPSGPRPIGLGPRRRVPPLRTDRDYEKMVVQTRKTLREAAPRPSQASRATQSKRRRRPKASGEPDTEEEPQEERDRLQLPLSPPRVGGGNLPGGARQYSPRRPRHLTAQNCLPPGVAASPSFLHRYRFLHRVLQQLGEKVHVLQTRRFWGRRTLGIAAFVGILHWIHLITLFENDRHFSHLSSLEREMTFRTEMGLYYSYFKTIIEAPSFLEGLWMIMNDRLTEYPLVINTVKRFHLYPEILSNLCLFKGLGDPACFYVGVIFILNGLMMGLFFIYGAYLSGTQLGGIITVLCYFFNHGEATRVMWTPPLRESFSYPFLVLQMCVLTLILRTSNTNRRHYIALCVSNVAFMLPWQFAQFILFTQFLWARISTRLLASSLET